MTKPPEHERRKQAKQAARFIRERLEMEDKDFDAGVILAGGWRQGLTFDKQYDPIPVRKVPGFEHWDERDGQARMLWSGKIGDRRVVALPEGLLLNYDMDYPASTRHMVRLQVEFMVQLGVKAVILTGSAAAVKDFSDGDVAVIRSFVSLFAPPRPLYSGEWVNPSGCLDPRLRQLALQKAASWKEHRAAEACYVTVPGPDVESEEDRRLMALAGGQVVGMHGLPEAAVASANNVSMLMLALVVAGEGAVLTRDIREQRAVRDSKRLGTFLADIISNLPDQA